MSPQRRDLRSSGSDLYVCVLCPPARTPLLLSSWLMLMKDEDVVLVGHLSHTLYETSCRRCLRVDMFMNALVHLHSLVVEFPEA